MAIPNYSFYNWNNTTIYSKWDVIYGSAPGDTRYFYSTLNNNLNYNPATTYAFTATQTTRTDNVMRVSFNQTSPINFQQGSVVNVYNVTPDSTANYTGLVLAAGSGYIDYLCPGLNATNVATNGTVKAPIHPAWTTGFMWIPSWSTEVSHEMAVINTKLGEGYSQRMNPTINSNSLVWNLTFAERTDRETMGLLNFLEVAGGATPFVISFPVGMLYNQPGLKYISGPARHTLTSYGLSTVTVPITQVFDI